MSLRLCAFVLLFAPVVSGALAAPVSCPALAAAVQVAACPSEEELKYTFTGFCSDNARMYSKDADLCTDYQRYRRVKNIALWESRDGAFQAYLSCDLPAASVKAARASAITIAKKGAITQLVCAYSEGLTFTSRTRAECTVDAKMNCANDSAACAANCE